MIIMVMDCTFVICFIYDGISSLDFLLAMKDAGIIVLRTSCVGHSDTD